MKGALVMFVLGLLLIVMNELTTDKKIKVITKYIPRDMDAWFRDPENQPMYMYSSTMFQDNIRM